MTKLFVAAMLCLLFCAAGVIGGEKSVFDYTLSTIDGQQSNVCVPVTNPCGDGTTTTVLPRS